MDARTVEIRQFKEQLTSRMKYRLDYANKELEARLRSLGEDLIKAADRLAKDPDDQTAVNSCGEVQYAGTQIDRLCGIRAVLLEDAKAIKSYLKTLL